MKKVLVMVLALVLVMSMAVPAFACRSASAPICSPHKPTCVPASCDGGDSTGSAVGCFVPIHMANILAEADRETFLASQKALKDAVPEGMNVSYFFFHNAVHPEHTLKIAATTVEVKNYVDNAWVEFPVTDNQDGTFTLVDMPKTPFAIFTK